MARSCSVGPGTRLFCEIETKTNGEREEKGDERRPTDVSSSQESSISSPPELESPSSRHPHSLRARVPLARGAQRTNAPPSQTTPSLASPQPAAPTHSTLRRGAASAAAWLAKSPLPHTAPALRSTRRPPKLRPCGVPRSPVLRLSVRFEERNERAAGREAGEPASDR